MCWFGLELAPHSSREATRGFPLCSQLLPNHFPIGFVISNRNTSKSFVEGGYKPTKLLQGMNH